MRTRFATRTLWRAQPAGRFSIATGVSVQLNLKVEHVWGDRSMQHLKNLPPMPARIGRALVAALILAACCAACTRAELENKADAYNAAIAQSNNRQILLNAVRASQRSPMSFVGFGDVSASPNYSGAANATVNFSPAGLTSYVLNPSVNYNGGFSNFALSNLNRTEYIQAIQRPIAPKLAQYFYDLKWPKELVDLMLVQSHVIKRGDFARIEAEVKTRCANRVDQRTREICQQLDDDLDAFNTQGCQEFPYSKAEITFLNTAREFCSMNTYQRFLRKARLLELNVIPSKLRSIQGMLYYLGELIAAQNYSVHPYIPMIYVETPDGHRRPVPLFEVRRGVPGVGQAAVEVLYEGDIFYIPKPAFGTIDEARSLQVLDLLSIALALQTTKDELPKSSTVTLIPAR
jgi:hypothetical protein